VPDLFGQERNPDAKDNFSRNSSVSVSGAATGHCSGGRLAAKLTARTPTAVYRCVPKILWVRVGYFHGEIDLLREIGC
jgi:hypothetical protein